MLPRERRSLETKSFTGGLGSIVFFRKQNVSENNKKFQISNFFFPSSCVEVKKKYEIPAETPVINTDFSYIFDKSYNQTKHIISYISMK
jgi:hypothetical protein